MNEQPAQDPRGKMRDDEAAISLMDHPDSQDVPRERVRMLTAAFEHALQDKALLAEARAQSLPIDLFSAESRRRSSARSMPRPPR